MNPPLKAMTGRCDIIAECASNHMGDPLLMNAMIDAAAEEGADWVKFQAYQTTYLSPSDGQYDHLRQAELSRDQCEAIIRHCREVGVRPLFSVFDPLTAEWTMNRLGVVKVGHAESWKPWVGKEVGAYFISTPWGRALERQFPGSTVVLFATIPVYPATPEMVAGVRIREGWSDHGVGLTVAKYFIARGVHYVEKHFSFPGKGRRQAWDMDPAGLRELAQWRDECATFALGTQQWQRWSPR